jgi:hypothetical protein
LERISAAELNGHFVSAIAQLAGADHFAGVGVAVAAGAEYLDFAGLSHCQRIF